MFVLWIYVGCTALIALRLGWYMRYRLDRFDWQYGDVWSSFWISLLMWFVLLLKPKDFIDFIRNPKLLGGAMSNDVAARMRELHRFQSGPPPCGELVRYMLRRDDCTDAWFVFLAETVELVLADSSPGTEHHDILRWVRQRDPECGELVDASWAWASFSEVASDLLDQGKGLAHCGRCGANTAASELSSDTVSIIGHSFRVWACPCGQVLLEVPRLQIHF